MPTLRLILSSLYRSLDRTRQMYSGWLYPGPFLSPRARRGAR